MKSLSLITALLALPLASPAFAAAHSMNSMTASVSSGGGGGIAGTVTLTPTASGETMVDIDLTGVPAGEHAIHIHTTGDCSAPDFTSAGGHLAGDKSHGVMDAAGPHPGDLPNIVVSESGVFKATHFNALLTPDLLDDADGAAFIMHVGTDDYTSQPAGDAGDRIACGVFAPAS